MRKDIYVQQKGQTLIEVLIGLAAAVAVMAAITTASLSALNNSQFSRNEDLAKTYAQQGMEIMKNLHKTDFSTFSQLVGTYCFAQSCNSIDPNPQDAGKTCALESGTTCPGILNAGGFIRTVEFHTNDDESAKCNTNGQVGNVKVIVSLKWNDQKCTNNANLYCHTVSLSSCFNNGEIIPTP